MAVGQGGGKPANYATSNIIGVDLTDNYPVYAIPGSAAGVIGTVYSNLGPAAPGNQIAQFTENSSPPFALGTRCDTTNSGEVVFCIVGTAGSINQFDVVAIDSNYNVQQASQTIGAPSTGSFMVGFNQNSINLVTGTAASTLSAYGIPATTPSTTSYYCWIAVRGDNLKVNTTTSVSSNAGSNLWLGSTPGTISTVSAGSTALIGGVNNPASASAATAMAFISFEPFFTTNTGN